MAPATATYPQVRALVTLIEHLDPDDQRRMIRMLWSRFSEMVEEEEDRLLAEQARKEHQRWVRSGRKTVPAAAVRRELEKSGAL